MRNIHDTITNTLWIGPECLVPSVWDWPRVILIEETAEGH